MTLPHIADSWISILLYCLLLVIICMGLWQAGSRYFLKKTGEFQYPMVPLGMAALAFSLIGLIKSYMASLQAADVSGAMTKVQLSHALVHGSLNGAPYPILGLLCLGLSFVFKYINR